MVGMKNILCAFFQEKASRNWRETRTLSGACRPPFPDGVIARFSGGLRRAGGFEARSMTIVMASSFQQTLMSGQQKKNGKTIREIHENASPETLDSTGANRTQSPG
jgi:hypothetical protein